MSIEAGPPPQPPQLSPDKKWIWDGNQWRPLSVQHEAIFPNWKQVGAGFTPQTDSAPAYRLAAPAPTMQAPQWKTGRASAGLNRYLYLAGGGVVGLIVLALVVTSIFALAQPAQQTPAAQATPTPTASPISRSDSARADHLVNGLLAAPMADLKDNLAQMRPACTVGMTTTCEDSLISTSNNVTAIKSAVGGVTVPLCIAAQQTKLRADVTSLDAGVQLALKGFKDNRKAEFVNGFNQVKSAGAAVQTDYARLSTAAKTCDPQLLGP